MSKPTIRITGHSCLDTGDWERERETPYHMFPSLTRLANGSYVACTLHGRAKLSPDGTFRIYRSDDGCRTWRELSTPLVHETGGLYGYNMCHITELATGEWLAVYLRYDRYSEEAPLFHPTEDGMQKCRVRISKSADGGQNWSTPKMIAFELPDMIVPGKCLVLDNGMLGIPCEVWKEWDFGFREGPTSRLIFSYDHGETWPDAAIMAKDAASASIFGDPRLTRLDDGRVVALFWRYSLADGKDMPVHRAESADGGRSWGEPVSTGLTGQIASPAALGGGLMLGLYQKRFGEDAGLRAILSHDNGFSWDETTDTAVYESGRTTASDNPFVGIADYTFGYSSLVPISDREMLAVYWRNRDGEEGTCIQISRIELSFGESPG